MTVLSISEYSSVTGAKGVLNCIYDFCTNNGWLNIDYQTSVEWQGTGGSGWTTGDDDFLEVRTLGINGNTDNRYRFLAEEFDANNDKLYCKTVQPNASTYDPNAGGASQYHPMNYGQYCAVPFDNMSSNFMKVNPATNTKVWCCGDDRWVTVVIQMSSSRFNNLSFGIPDLIDEFADYTWAFWYACYGYSGYSGDWDAAWSSIKTYIPISIWPGVQSGGYHCYFEDSGSRIGGAGSLCFYSDINISVCNYDLNSYTTSHWAPMKYVFYDTPRGVPFMHRPNLFFKHPAPGQEDFNSELEKIQYYHIGRSPIYMFNGVGQSVGTEVTMGQKEFTYLPFGDPAEYDTWMAVRTQ